MNWEIVWFARLPSAAVSRNPLPRPTRRRDPRYDADIVSYLLLVICIEETKNIYFFWLKNILMHIMNGGKDV